MYVFLEIDECALGTSACASLAFCVNTPGSYICVPYIVTNSIVIVSGVSTVAIVDAFNDAYEFNSVYGGSIIQFIVVIH